MRLVLQRVSQAAVSVEDREIARIGRGYLLLLCVMQGDAEDDAKRLAEKVSGLRLFDAPDGKINDKSLLDTGGEALVVSQFTLAGDVRKGRRPDYTAAAAPGDAKRLYEFFAAQLLALGVRNVQTGSFGAMMEVALINDGPVTLYLDSK